jgi:transposase
MATIARGEVFLGLDYHQSSIQICVLDSDGKVRGNRSVSNELGAVREFVDHVAEGCTVRGGALEACCGAANLAEQLRRTFDWDIGLAHAGVCSRMKQNPDKTDFSDSHLLADLVRVGYLPRVWLPPQEIRDLRRLTRYHTQLVEQRRNVKLRIRALLREERIESPAEAGNVWTKAWLRWLRSMTELGAHSRWVMDQHLDNLDRIIAELKKIEQRMEEATREDAVTQQLIAEKGIGLVTAVTIRAEIGSFDRFRCGKQLARYCAVTPKNASSGKRQADAGLIDAGNLPLRTLLIEAAHRLCRYSPKWQAMKQRLKQARKPAGVIAAAVANRWVRQLFWQIRKPSESDLSVAA